jgi:intracellular sulfur oxidation DsrE/DsrF family protein
MAKKVLQIIESAYRCTVEEQDEPIVWITHAMKGAGGDFGVLLRGNAVNYAVKGQDASGLSIGGKVHAQPPRVDNDLVSLIGKGVEVYVVEDDVAVRGLERSELIDGVKPVSRAGVAKLFGGYDQIWHW